MDKKEELEAKEGQLIREAVRYQISEERFTRDGQLETAKKFSKLAKMRMALLDELKKYRKEEVRLKETYLTKFIRWLKKLIHN